MKKITLLALVLVATLSPFQSAGASCVKVSRGFVGGNVTTSCACPGCI